MEKIMRATRPHSCGSLFCDCVYSTGSCIKLYSKLNPTKPLAKKPEPKRDGTKAFDDFQKNLLNQYYRSTPATNLKSPSLVNSRRTSSVTHRNSVTNDRFSFSNTGAKKVSFGDRASTANINRGLAPVDSARRSRKSEHFRKSNGGSDRKSSDRKSGDYKTSDRKTTFIRLSTIWKAKDTLNPSDFTGYLNPSHYEPKKSIFLHNQPISFVELLNERNPKCSLIRIENFETIEAYSSEDEDYENFYTDSGELLSSKMGKLEPIIVHLYKFNFYLFILRVFQLLFYINR